MCKSKLHSGHQGTTKCYERARQPVWWPGIRSDLEDVIRKCIICSKHRTQHAELLLPSAFPDHHWQKVASDLFEWKRTNYLLIVDYYSRYIEIAKLSSTTSNDIINHLKSVFARHGIPQTFMSDNGPQYSASTFTQFAKEYGFSHITSSPRYPQSNGAAERAVKTVKALLEKDDDPYLALLTYRATPLENGYSPSELLMGRKLRTPIPVVPTQLLPKLPKTSKLKEKKWIRQRQRKNFNLHHRASELKPLQTGDYVWIPDTRSEGIVVQETNPQSYEVETPSGTYRRNRRHIIPLKESAKDSKNQDENAKTSPDVEVVPNSNQDSKEDSYIRTRSGRVSKPPDRL